MYKILVVAFFFLAFLLNGTAVHAAREISLDDQLEIEDLWPSYMTDNNGIFPRIAVLTYIMPYTANDVPQNKLYIANPRGSMGDLLGNFAPENKIVIAEINSSGGFDGVFYRGLYLECAHIPVLGESLSKKVEYDSSIYTQYSGGLYDQSLVPGAPVRCTEVEKDERLIETEDIAELPQEDRDMIDEAKARAYCLAGFGPLYVPYLKYRVDSDGSHSLQSSECILNTHVVGDSSIDTDLVCRQGIKEVSINNFNVKACIGIYDSTDLANPQNRRGVEVSGLNAIDYNTISNKDTIPGTGTSDINYNSIFNRDTIGSVYTPRPPRRGAVTPPRPPRRYVPPTGTQSQTSTTVSGGYTTVSAYNQGTTTTSQYTPVVQPPAAIPQQSQQRGSSLWNSLKNIIGGPGGFFNKGPDKPKPKCTVFMSLEDSINKGESTTLQWSLDYTSSAYLTPSIGLVNPTQGSLQVSPTETTTYTMQTHNKNGYGNCAPVTVTVLDDTDNPEPIDTTDKSPLIKCSPDKVKIGEPVVVLWQCPKGTVSSTGGSTEYPDFRTYGKISDSAKVDSVQENGKFVVRCMGETGEEIGRNSCDVEVVDSGGGATGTSTNPVAYIVADKTEVNSGDIVTIAWRGDNVDGCMITGPGGFKKYATKGSVTGRMLQTSKFTLSCVVNNVILADKDITIKVK